MALFWFAICSCGASETHLSPHHWREKVSDFKTPGHIQWTHQTEIDLKKSKTLSVQDAIFLSLRNNPEVKSAGLERIVQKLAVLVAHHAFEPSWNLKSMEFGSDDHHTAGIGVALHTLQGTQLDASYEPDWRNGSFTQSAQVNITQNLWRGFGSINEIPWQNTLDSEEKARLLFKFKIMNQINRVIERYNQLVQDDQNLKIQKNTLRNSFRILKESRLRFRVGQLARSDLTEQKAAYQSTRLAWLSQKSARVAHYQNFLELLGLPSSVRLSVNHHIFITDAHPVPKLKRAIACALQHNIPYQIAKLDLRASVRELKQAQDAKRIGLDVTGSWNLLGDAPNPHMGIRLSIPLDTLSLTQRIIDAQVKIEQDQLQFKSRKWSLIRSITEQIAQIRLQKSMIRVAQQQVELQKKNLHTTMIKYQYGRTTTFEMNQIRNQLLSQKMNLISDQIILIEKIENLYQDLGLTLKRWQIQLKY